MTQSKGTHRSEIDTDRFVQTLRQTLEHIDDAGWLDKRSPLASVFFAAAPTAAPRRRQIALTGLSGVDDRLRTTWHHWEARAKSPLQSVIWEAVCHLPPDLETYTQAILLLTYFEEPRPKQSEVVQLLAMGRSTYYRYLEKSVATLGETLVQLLRPALQLEQPEARPLIGRAMPLAQAQQALRAGRVVHLVGGGGMGKTSLGAQLARGWSSGRVFWYTFRLGLTDHLDQLIFALAYFFHLQGVSGLWLHLNTNPQEISSSKTIAILRQHLAALGATPPLFCLDEVDLLLAGDLHDTEQHRQLRDFLDDLAHSSRPGAAMLLIGQKVLLEPDEGCLIALSPLVAEDVGALLSAARVALDADQKERLLTFTRGNPLLLHLFLVLHKRGAPLTETLQRLTAPVTIDWFVTRLRQHLTAAELAVLYELSVFSGSAPRAAWRTSQKSLRTLLELGLAEAMGAESIGLHPALRTALYQQLSPERKTELHLAAANLYAEQSRFTAAAYHYTQGSRPDMAVWIWYRHRQQEIAQGQASTALEIFSVVAPGSLPEPEDQRVLALLLAQLSGPAGRTQEGLDALAGVTWPASTPSTIHAHELRGELLSDIGEIDRALAEYRRSLESLASLRASQEINLRINIGRRALGYLGDAQQARGEVWHARFELEVLQGEIENALGNYAAAHDHYTNALSLASSLNDEHRLAKLHEALGILEARYAHLETAVAHIQAAGRHYQAAGNLVCAVGVMNTNLSYAYLIKRRYADAVAPAQTALAFFGELNHPYWLALNEANLAEAYFYLGQVERAEAMAVLGLQREEVVVRAYCLYILAHVRRSQRRYSEAVGLCREAIEAGEKLQDPWALGPAWRALGETYRDNGRIAEARAAFEEVLRIYQQLGVEQEIAFTHDLLAGLPVEVEAPTAW